jgi:hypothetical protein
MARIAAPNLCDFDKEFRLCKRHRFVIPAVLAFTETSALSVEWLLPAES